MTATAGLLSGRLGRNVFYNLLGLSAPLLAAVIAIPPLMAELGVERFGVLAVMWVVIGYFSLFDLGIGRALTQRVAEAAGRGTETEVPVLVATALLLMALLGMAGAVLLAAMAPWAAGRMTGDDAALAIEASNAFRILALSIPVVVTAAGLRGLLEARQYFGSVNINRAAMGVLMFVAPLGALAFSPRLTTVVLALLGVRIGSWLGYWHACRRRGLLPGAPTFSSSVARRLLSYGGWMTVTNIVGPIMDTLDRVLIGMLAGAAAVAYYATPAEVVTKVLVLPAAVAAAFFPALAAEWVRGRERPRQLYAWGLKSVCVGVVPATATLYLLAPDILGVWLNAEFAARSADVMRWLALGVTMNSLAQIPFALIQAAGRPRQTALLHLCELPLYLVAVWVLLPSYGVIGAAWAWTARAGVDGIALFVMARRQLDMAWRSHLTPMILGMLILSALFAGSLLESLAERLLCLGGLLVVFAVSMWTLLLSTAERSWLLARLSIARAP